MNRSSLIAIFSGVFALFVVAMQIFAFTEPTQPPPAGNVPAPLNVGNLGQVKEGGLMLNTGGAPIGLIVDKGSVGIGTTNIKNKTKLQIKSGIDQIGQVGFGGPLWQDMWYDGGSNSHFVFSNTGDSSGSTEFVHYDSTLPENHKTLMFIHNNGNVGIGTIDPKRTLDVDGSTVIREYGGDGPHILVIESKDPNESTIEFNYGNGYNYPGPDPKFFWEVGLYDQNFNIHNSVSDGNGWWKATLDIDNNGNVGIGTRTPAPNNKLDVVGKIHATGDICTDAGGGKCLSKSPKVIIRSKTVTAPTHFKVKVSVSCEAGETLTGCSGFFKNCEESDCGYHGAIPSDNTCDALFDPSKAGDEVSVYALCMQ